MSCKRGVKLSLHIMASTSQRSLPQRLSNKRLALIIPKSNKLLQRIRSSCQNSEKSRSTKTTQKQLRSTQSYSRDKLLLGNSQKASTFHTPSCTVARPLIKSSASLGPSQRSPRALSQGTRINPGLLGWQIVMFMLFITPISTQLPNRLRGVTRKPPSLKSTVKLASVHNTPML